MRITNSMMNNMLLNSIQSNLSRMDKKLSHIQTGKMVNRPSDDAVATSKILGYNVNLSEFEQYDKNIKDALSTLEITESTIEQVGDVMHRARELAVQAANETNSAQERKKIKAEIISLKGQLISSGNYNFNGKYIFSGYNTDQPLFDKADATDGTEAIINSDIHIKDPKKPDRLKLIISSKDQFDYTTHGIEVFGFDKNTGKSTLIEDYNKFIKALEDDDTDAIGNFLTNADNHMNRILAQRADVGARTSRLDLVKKRLEADTISFTGMLAKTQDTDMAEEIMLLKNAENVYKASLSTGAKIIQPTLLDFLR